MAEKTTNLYLYLARRDKKGIRIVAKFTGRMLLPTRLDTSGLKSLQLPEAWYTQINQIIYDNRMLWEPWIQSWDDTFEQLRVSLKKRGYTNIPISPQPEFTSSTVTNQKVNISYLPQRKTMLRKTKSP